MDSRELMLKVLNAEPLRQELIERILDFNSAELEILKLALENTSGRQTPSSALAQNANTKLLTITDACRLLNVNYSKMYRIMRDGLLDIIDATGKRMIREESLIEYSMGQRQPSPEVLARREAQNALRRRQYAQRKGASTCQE